MAPSNLRVVALALDGVVTFDLGCAVQSFARGPGPLGDPGGFELETCGLRPGRVRTPDGFDLHVARGLEALAGADFVLVPGHVPHDAPVPEAALDALRDAHGAGATVMSICIGAFILAEAGLLDGRRATTHWAYCDELATRHPAIDVDPRVLYVDDGDLLTSAGLAAGLDLCVHVVRRHRGEASAAQLARWNVIAPHREGGQAQFIPAPLPTALTAPIAPTLAWAAERLDQPLTIADLARHACMSERTVSRQFRAQLGTTPKAWVLAQRVARARELLETTDLPIEHVASRAGFPSAAALRTHLRRRTATTPSAYRSSFGAPADSSHRALRVTSTAGA